MTTDHRFRFNLLSVHERIPLNERACVQFIESSLHGRAARSCAYRSKYVSINISGCGVCDLLQNRKVEWIKKAKTDSTECVEDATGSKNKKNLENPRSKALIFLYAVYRPGVFWWVSSSAERFQCRIDISSFIFPQNLRRPKHITCTHDEQYLSEVGRESRRILESCRFSQAISSLWCLSKPCDGIRVPNGASTMRGNPGVFWWAGSSAAWLQTGRKDVSTFKLKIQNGSESIRLTHIE